MATSLIVTGPNRLTRNPIYLGFAGLLTAHALWRATPAALLPVAGFVAALTPQIGHEEEALLTRFGDDYGSYVRRVPRWVGRPRS
ncbi:isoprenylcysteine carboxylmethyltransferase family protein [Tessaracoccus sp. HDW20]|uniref:methyltransferase family protein n=1 Tax=Tessaracoccus coleopterorum TaxID=2714950 RepID=UPI0018D3AB08|nr:isoprenylcysteine carboxylmethyltransferase family protein [Tessaracoccus coleopterorum]NHB85534.1 isoprenylcysteine carboxylmethyltransferase family protein [Tessaracoccus coleopterorum]